MNVLGLLFSQNSRYFGAIVPDLVIRENHRDTMEITAHPVEFGAETSDHTFANPAEVSIDMMFGSGGSLVDFYDTSTIGVVVGKSPSDIYQEILNLKNTRQPFDLSTGKRKYKNMLIKSISVSTEERTEYVLSISIDFREVFITSANNAVLVPIANQKYGNITSGKTNIGAKQPVSVNTEDVSILGDITGNSGYYNQNVVGN